MSEFRVDIYAAVREAADAARATAVPGPCQICGASGSPAYVFAYGKETGRTTTEIGPKRVTTISYDAVQARAVNLCGTCVDAARKAQERRATVITGSLLGIGLLALIGGFVVPGRVGTVLPAIGVAFWIFALLAWVRLRLTKTVPRQAGQQRALDLQVEALKRQGFDAFWADSITL